MHCHIGWHLSEGFSLQWIEQQSQITSLYNNGTEGTTGVSDVCATWNKASTAARIVEDDSGV